VLGIFSKWEKLNWRSVAKFGRTCISLRLTGLSGVHQAIIEHPKTSRHRIRASSLVDWDLFWAVTLLCYRCALLFCFVCVGCCKFVSCIWFYSPLTRVFIWDQLCKAWETNCGDSSQRDIFEIKIIVVFKLIFGSLERGWVQPSSVGTPQHGVGKYSAWPNHEIKITVSPVFILLRFSLYSLHLHYCSKFNTHLVKSN
jgi:hypothetical protein